MSKVSKTARASAGVVVKETKVISDETYIKSLRNDLESGLYVAQEGARALLRAYDTLYKNNQALDAELQAALKQVAELQAELNNIITGSPDA